MKKSRPPPEAIEAAAQAARQSPCMKSKRGVCLYARLSDEILIAAAEFNGPPAEIGCDGSEACRAACAQRCVHAEMRALRSVANMKPRLNKFHEILHVKVVDGWIVAGGGPSCWQCSREILDIGIDGVWLFQRDVLGSDGISGSTWLFYDSLTFHRATLDACEIGGPR